MIWPRDLRKNLEKTINAESAKSIAVLRRSKEDLHKSSDLEHEGMLKSFERIREFEI